MTDSLTLESSEEIESAADDGQVEYPLASVLVRSEMRTIQDVLRKIDDGQILLDPDFQRDFVWKSDRQSALVESVLARIPLPVFYVAEDKEGRLIAVDGLQRLTTLHRFYKNELELELANPELKGRTFEKLDRKLQNRFQDGQLHFYIIDSKVPERVRLDIFNRVNSGVPLTRQQMRNAIYNGPATRLLKRLADHSEFRSATRNVVSRQSHRKDQLDREVVNRFLAFHVLGPDAYGKEQLTGMQEFLGAALAKVNGFSDGQVARIEQQFVDSMINNQKVFERLAFRRHTSADEAHARFNLALFEVFSVLFASYAPDRVAEKSPELREAFYQLMRDEAFASTLGNRTTDPKSIGQKFQLATRAISEVLGDP